MIQILENLRATFCVMVCIFCVYDPNEVKSIIKRIVSIISIIIIAITQLILEPEPLVTYHLIIVGFWGICLILDVIRLIQVKRIKN